MNARSRLFLSCCPNMSTQEQVGEDRWTDISPSIKGVVNLPAILKPQELEIFFLTKIVVFDIKVMKLYSTLTRLSWLIVRKMIFWIGSDWMLFNRGCFLNHIHSLNIEIAWLDGPMKLILEEIFSEQEDYIVECL